MIVSSFKSTRRTKPYTAVIMLQPLLNVLNSQRIVLASGSPRRKEILENVGLKFSVVPSTYEEDLDKSNFPHPYEYVLKTAELKGKEVKERLQKIGEAPDILICADTVVTMDGCIYEKPSSTQDAFRMLSLFSGRQHTVFTGVVLLHKKSDDSDFAITRFYESADVQFADLTPQVINSYIDTGEPMDKAGGYGIQGVGSTLIEKISGDFYTIMGFPVCKFSQVIVKLFEDQIK